MHWGDFVAGFGSGGSWGLLRGSCLRDGSNLVERVAGLIRGDFVQRVEVMNRGDFIKRVADLSQGDIVQGTQALDGGDLV